jgi:hypothetical protein
MSAGDMDGFGPDIRKPPMDESPGAKIKFKLGGTFQFFNRAPLNSVTIPCFVAC